MISADYRAVLARVGEIDGIIEALVAGAVQSRAAWRQLQQCGCARRPSRQMMSQAAAMDMKDACKKQQGTVSLQFQITAERRRCVPRAPAMIESPPSDHATQHAHARPA
jgi:hypothetical protein